ATRKPLTTFVPNTVFGLRKTNSSTDALQMDPSKTRWASNYIKKMLLKPPLPPMEARSVAEIPTGDGWQYEPKWDGLRCLAFRDDKEAFLQSQAGRPLGRYFPDVVAQIQALKARYLVLAGELVIPIHDI